MGLSDTDTNLFTGVIKYKNSLNYINTDNQLQEFIPRTSQSKKLPLPTQADDAQEKIVNKLHQKQKRLNNEEIAQIIAGYKSGQTMRELAREFGCHRTTVSSNLKKHG